jgi:hypothetical protein
MESLHAGMPKTASAYLQRNVFESFKSKNFLVKTPAVIGELKELFLLSSITEQKSKVEKL